MAVALPFRFQELGLPVVQYGIALAAYALGTLLTETLWGVMAFRLATVSRMLPVGVAVILIVLTLGVARSFLSIALLEALFGALNIFLLPLIRWTAFTAGGPGSGGQGAGRFSAVLGVGFALGTVAGPLAFVLTGFEGVAVMAAALFAGSLILAGLVPWDRAELPSKAPESPRSWREFGDRPFVIALGLVFAGCVAYTLTQEFFQYYSITLFGGTPTEAGLVLGAAGVARLIGSFVIGGIADRRGAMHISALGFALLVVGAVGSWASRSYLELAFATLEFSAAQGWLLASLVPVVMRHVSKPMEGAAFGVLGSVEDFGQLVGPVLYGVTWSTLGATSIFPLTAAIAATGGLVATLSISSASRTRANQPPGDSQGR